MANERDDEQFGKQDREKEFGQDKQRPTENQGQQGQQGQFGQQGQQGQGTQGDLGRQPDQMAGGQSSSGQADPGRSGETDTLSGERGFGQGTDGGQSGSGQPGSSGGSQGGFVGSQGTGSDAYLREQGSTGGSDFAKEGQGALEGEDEDIETGQRRNRDSDIEGGSGNI